jgi:hypothetical protein
MYVYLVYIMTRSIMLTFSLTLIEVCNLEIYIYIYNLYIGFSYTYLYNGGDG